MNAINAQCIMVNKWKSAVPAGRQGFTVVEMLLYLGLLTITMTIMTQLFTSILDVQLESEATSAIEQDSRYLFSRFIYDIGRATSISLPGSLGASSSSLTLVIDGVSYAYAVDNDTLVLTNDTGTSALTSVQTRISDLTFTRLGNQDGKHALQIRFTLESQTERVAGPEQKTLQTTIALR